MCAAAQLHSHQCRDWGAGARNRNSLRRLRYRRLRERTAGDTTMMSPHDQERLAAFVDRFIVGAEIAPPFQAEAGTRRQKWTSQQRALESHNRDRAFLY